MDYLMNDELKKINDELFEEMSDDDDNALKLKNPKVFQAERFPVSGNALRK